MATSSAFTNLPAYLTAPGNTTLGPSPITAPPASLVGSSSVTWNDLSSLFASALSPASSPAAAAPVVSVAGTPATSIPGVTSGVSSWLSQTSSLGVSNETLVFGGVAFAVVLAIVLGAKRRR